MKVTNKILAFLLLLTMLGMMMGSFSLSASAAVPAEVKGKTVSQVLGMDPDIYMNWLLLHETDDYYLGTPYHGYDYRNPNGDCSGAYGTYDKKGQPGMNCTGFVWHVLYKATKASGKDTSSIPALGRMKWYNFYNNNKISRKYFSSKSEMLNSGYLEKGDIIWMYVNGTELIANDYHHVGIYWGDGHSDVFWHSSDNTGSNLKGNVVSKVIPKLDQNITYMVLKVGASQLATVKIEKTSADPSVAKNNARYSFAGIRYCFYSKKADAESPTYDIVSTTPSYIGYMELNKDGTSWNYSAGSRVTIRNLNAGTYYVREFIPPSIKNTVGYELLPTVYTVKVTVNHSRLKPFVLKITEPVKYGHVEVIKSSSNPTVTDNNPEYTFDNIRYAFYTKQSEAASDNYYDTKVNTSFVGNIRLNAEGYGNNWENGSTAKIRSLPLGVYYVREYYPPAIRDTVKYELDNTVYKVDVKANHTETVPLTLAVTDTPTVPDQGYGKVIKISANSEVTDGNELYSVQGAEFGIYLSEEDADDNQQPIHIIVTDQNGVATTPVMEEGTYWIRELSAPDTFLLNDEVMLLSITANQTTTVYFADQPKMCCPQTLLTKKDVANEDMVCNLDGAKYEVNFYTGLYHEDQLASLAPTRKWIFETEGNGQCPFDRDHLYSGDALYLNENEDPAFPLGTLMIKEIQAPEGYLLDKTVYIVPLTVATANDIRQYNMPISYERSIPNINVSVHKVWVDDNDRDGRRPDTLSIDLVRDGIIIRTVQLSNNNRWGYTFSSLPEGCADVNAEGGYHCYDYDVHESQVNGYEPETTSLVKGNSPYEFVCTFTNTYKPELISLTGEKCWEDLNNILGRRPESISVILYRDGAKFQMQTVTAANNWKYEFDNLYKYHDSGKKYVYTIDEQNVTGYRRSINGTHLVNTWITGKLIVFKTNPNHEPMAGVKFRVYSSDIENDGIVSTESNGTYHFKNFESTDSGCRIYTTDDNGKIVIDGLPYGHYKVVEVSTLDGYMLYDKPIHTTIDYHTPNVSVAIEAENAKAILPETGGIGNNLFGMLAVTLAAVGVVLLCSYNLNNIKIKKD